tara:strand:- start:596 stop:1375 length:780 start_codon:yes stop_codon:yes gene_type:complete
LTSVDFSDYLDFTLPHNRFIFDDIYVVTSPQDGNSVLAAKHNEVKYIVTDAFGSQFNKGAAINEGLKVLREEGEEWVLITDADIFWPPKLKDYIPGLEFNSLYGFYRRVLQKEDLGIFGKENEYHGLLEGIDGLYLGGDYKQFATMKDLAQIIPIDARSHLQKMEPFFKIEDPEVFKAMGWNSNVESTLEDPLPLGYGQLFNCQVHGDKNYPENFETAAGCDSYFSSLWAQDFRKFILKISTLHLGPRMVHWDGRKVLE